MWLLYSIYMIAATFARATIALIATIVIAALALYTLSEIFS